MTTGTLDAPPRTARSGAEWPTARAKARRRTRKSRARALARAAQAPQDARR